MKIYDLIWTPHPNTSESDFGWFVETPHGVITIVDRMTGFGWRDVETGFTDHKQTFWLASGDFDIREYAELDLIDAIEKIMDNANSCVAVDKRKNTMKISIEKKKGSK